MSVFGSMEAVVASGRKYGVIYADPPWHYRYWCPSGPGTREAAEHYDTMDMAAICALPVGEIAAEDAWLFMWVTWPLLYETAPVWRAWGFRYTTCAFNWVKTNASNASPRIGMGRGIRANSEVCLYGRRGSPPTLSHAEAQPVLTVPRAHSQKPIEPFERIERMCGGVPRIELFCRGHARHGWDAMGREARAAATLEGVLA